MGIESNKEAMAMVKKALSSIENRFREAYNKGYKDGLRDGASQVTAKLVSKILEETEADIPQTDKNDRSTAVFITGTQIGDVKPIPNSITTWASINTSQTEKGYMWTCPKCGTENHSDFKSCPCCGYTPQKDCPWK